MVLHRHNAANRIILLSILIAGFAHAAPKKKPAPVNLRDQAAKAPAVRRWVQSYKAGERRLPALKKAIGSAETALDRTTAAVKAAKDESKSKVRIRVLTRDLAMTDMMCDLSERRIVGSIVKGAVDHESLRDRHDRERERLAKLKSDPSADPQTLAAAASDFVALRNLMTHVDEAMKTDANLRVATQLSASIRSEIEWEYCSSVYRKMLAPSRRMVVKASDRLAKARRAYDKAVAERNELKSQADRAFQRELKNLKIANSGRKGKGKKK